MAMSSGSNPDMRRTEPDDLEEVFRSIRPRPQRKLERRMGVNRVLDAVVGKVREEARVGRFVLQDKIGWGRMGVVYRAYDPQLERALAVKLLRRDYTGHERERLVREAKALARLSDPGVVTIYDAGTHDGAVFIAMEHVAGVTLRTWLRAQPDAGWREILEHFVQAGRGLAAAHRAGIVHRDFKPDNVLVGDDGRTRVADFGLARLDPRTPRDDPGADESLQAGIVAGTPETMAPEQRRGDRVDWRADQYSLCLTMWRALLPDVEPGRRSRTSARVPRTLRTILQRGLMADPAARWPSMEDLLDALETVRRPAPAERDRAVLLDRVERFWIDGVLEDSLDGLPFVPVGLRAKEAVDAGTAFVSGVARKTTTEALPQLFERADEALLILGAAGSGKTTAMLGLARQLVEDARLDPLRPVPLMLNLASWVEKEDALRLWIEDELLTKYSLPRRCARAWLRERRLVLMLDGLDEVTAARRRACVESINQFRRDHDLPMVVCCREDAYADLDLRLRLRGAVVVDPLDDEQIRAFLSRLGDTGRTITETLERDPALRAEIRTPLMLHILRVAAAGSAPGELRGHLLSRYVEVAFERRPLDPRYPKDRMMGGLAWLARAMQRHGLSELWLERLQAGWLPTPRARRFALGLGPALVATLVVGANLGGGVLADGLRHDHTPVLMLGLLTAPLVFVFNRGFRVRPVEALTWSWRRASGHLPLALAMGLLTGAAYGASFVLGGGLVLGTAGAILVALLLGLHPSDIESRVRPNQGILQSGRNALVIGGTMAVMAGLFHGVLVVPLLVRMFGDSAVARLGIVPGVSITIGTGICYGMLVGMVYGGAAYVLHAWLRLVIAVTSPLPLSLRPFLDDAVDRALMRRVGGGYIFMHRTLLEHFAAREGEGSK